MDTSLLSKTYFGNSIGEYSIAIGIILFSIIVGKSLYYFINRHVKKAAGKTENQLDDLIIDIVEEPMVLTIFSIGLYLGFTTLTLPAKSIPITNGLTTLVFILSAVWLILRLIDVLLKNYITPFTSKTDTHLDEQLLPIISKGAKGGVISIGILIVLDTFGVNISALIAGLGVGGLAVALAAKDTVENMFGAFAILLDKPFRIKDKIVIDGVTGEVLEVGFRSTRIKTLDNTELTIPNSKVMRSNIENISRPDKYLATSSILGLTYDMDLKKIEKAIELVKNILENTEGVSKSNKPVVAFKEFGSYSQNIFVKYWVRDYRKRLTTVDMVNRQIKTDFEKSKIQFAFPTQTIHLEK